MDWVASAELRSELARLAQAGRYRARRVVEGPQGPLVCVAGRQLLNFSSNDYLGLANHPELVAALGRAAGRWGVGSGAAHLITGHSGAHQALEEALAAFTGQPRALLFSTGYMANLGVISALAGRGDNVWEDRLNHASLIDGALLSRARLRRYRHLDAADLAGRLGVDRARLIATDGVFSMDGDLAPLPALAEVADRAGVWLLVDDAHGLGVLGAHGRGSFEHWGLAPRPDRILMATLGKALGTFGAFVAGSEELIETLIQRSRTYVYTTATPPALAEATRVALAIAEREDWRRTHLHALIARFRAGAAQLGLPLAASTTPIQPLIAGSAPRALALSRHLERAGLLVAAIRPPTVPEGQARLRITLSAAHDEAAVDRLLEALGSWSGDEET
ncbi:8-amino-7-oxononanoate synthase [Thioalkalicoccus limnaeus]|uniref:8-amino-7-oxononanoate synthase n=1 Tax=Thioalkalicoccus limnaeus TaxID=120681 RepID=A0ABV4BIJ4_9GAMM